MITPGKSLWIFGDSFSVGSTFKNESLWKYESNWIDMLKAEYCPDHDIKNHSQFGVSNEFIFEQFGTIFSKIADGDICIIQTTSAARHWFFENDPALSNLGATHLDNYSKEQKKAIEYYLKYLQNDKLDDILYTQFLYAVSYFLAARPNVQFLILPGFGDAPHVTGNLQNICEGEFNNADVIPDFYKKHYWDPRLNHISYENHSILAKKIAEYFREGTKLDLTKDFVSNIYSSDYMGEDKEYMSIV